MSTLKIYIIDMAGSPKLFCLGSESILQVEVARGQMIGKASMEDTWWWTFVHHTLFKGRLFLFVTHAIFKGQCFPFVTHAFIFILIGSWRLIHKVNYWGIMSSFQSTNTYFYSFIKSSKKEYQIIKLYIKGEILPKDLVFVFAATHCCNEQK